jgi:hypothetical protein
MAEGNVNWEIYKKYGYAIVNTPRKKEEEQNNDKDLSQSPSKMIRPLPYPPQRGCCGRW